MLKKILTASCFALTVAAVCAGFVHVVKDDAPPAVLDNKVYAAQEVQDKDAISLTYSVYYVDETGGEEVKGLVKSDVPFNTAGTSINITAPVLTGMQSSSTMLVYNNHNGTEHTYAGSFVSDYGMDCVDFDDPDGFSTFTFIPTEHWIEYIPRVDLTTIFRQLPITAIR